MAKATNSDFDLASLDVTDASTADLKSERRRTSKYERSPLRAPLTESYETDTAKRLNNVPDAAIDAVVRELRGVARILEIGIRIKVAPSGDGVNSVTFLGKDPRGAATEAEETVLSD